MLLLIIFAFIAGIVTILSPCILPILPIVLSSSVDTSGKRRPLGVVVGFVASFTFFTLFLSLIVKFSGIPAESLRYISVFILILFGLSFLIPTVQNWLEQLFSKLASYAPSSQGRHGFVGGIVIGLSLGLLWTPCVGPILASVISLAISGAVTVQAFLITLAYASGTAIPMFMIMLAGSTALQKVPWLLQNTSRIQKVFGILMILTALGIFFNLDRRFQSYVLTTFPTYGVGLTKIEDNEAVRNALEALGQKPTDNNAIGKPMSEVSLPKGPIAPELIPGGRWFNSKPLTLDELRGKVVLIDFWTYSCINCQRTLPYLKDWYSKYKDKGLVIIGVHSPEFEFEKSEQNVAQAVKDFGITYPVMQDNDFATWRAYSNRYWPAKYIIDKDGVVRYTHFGEGEYDETEKVIQELLQEAGAKGVSKGINNAKYDVYSQTPEIYLGYERLAGFASPEQINPNVVAVYTKPEQLGDSQVAFAGKWLIAGEYANPQKGARLYLNFGAKEVFLVMRTKGDPAKVKVLLDGKMQDFGADNKNGIVTVQKDTLYKLIMLPTSGRHELELQFEDANAELFAFTFG
jgi:cytochrome c biogenesis protein CcdA/thiol-disulfide isomerase/thioredoxin